MNTLTLVVNIVIHEEAVESPNRTPSCRQHDISWTAERYAFVLGMLLHIFKTNKIDNCQTHSIKIYVVTAVIDQLLYMYTIQVAMVIATCSLICTPTVLKWTGRGAECIWRDTIRMRTDNIKTTLGQTLIH